MTATSFRRIVPLYSITIACFSMSLAANSPRPCDTDINYAHRKQNPSAFLCQNWQILKWQCYLDARTGQIHIGSPLTLHPAVLRRSGMYYWGLTVGGATFSLGYILVRPGTAAGYNLWLRPLCWTGDRRKENKNIRNFKFTLYIQCNLFCLKTTHKHNNN